jgi:Zn-dependent protease with chaperone function
MGGKSALRAGSGQRQFAPRRLVAAARKRRYTEKLAGSRRVQSETGTSVSGYLERGSMTRARAPDVPERRTEPREPAAAPTLDDLLAGLPERIEPIRRPWAYRVRLAVALGTLLAVLALYIGLVVVTSYGVWSHLASERFVAAVHRVFGGLGAYAAFCVAGPFLCVFLVKPVFSLWGREPGGVTLDRSVEPRLFAFVARLCAAQGVPMPRQIRVDTDVNASAALRHGLISLFRRDLVLTIGLPLARALTLREFAGVLAHEFGHFAQGGGMRLSYLTRKAIDFLLRIAYVRDGFDQALIAATERFLFQIDPRLIAGGLFLLGVRGFLWLARALMKGLAYVALAASGALLRQMEYDADRHEARVAGSEAFASVGDKLVVLGAARPTADSLLQRWWQGGRLADDIPGLIVATAAGLAARPERLQQIRQQALNQQTGWLDTHPALRDRLARAARAAEPGSIAVNAPAAVLFRDLDALCRAVTVAHYGLLVEDSIASASLIAVAELLKELEGDPETSRLLARYTQGCPLAAGHVALGPPSLAAASADEAMPSEEATRSLEAARRRVQELAPTAIETVRRMEELGQRHAKLELTAALMRPFTATGAPSPDREIALGAARQAAIEIDAAARALVPLAEAVNDRLRIALRLRRSPAVAATLDTSDPVPLPCELLAASLDGLGAARAKRDRLRSSLTLLQALRERLASEPNSIRIERRVSETSAEVLRLVTTLRQAVALVPYPFPTAVLSDGQSSRRPVVGMYLGPVTTARDASGADNLGADLLARIRRIEERALSALVVTAEQIESAFGLPPLPDPETPPAEPSTE